MMHNYTHITILLDVSSSMEGLRRATVDGYNEFVGSHKAAIGHATLTQVQFNDDYMEHLAMAPISTVPDMQMRDYVPRGTTALHAAMCRAIDETGERLRKLPEAQRPAKVIFVAITDGLENASHYVPWFRADAFGLHNRISRQKKDYGWEFVYIGANQDAIAAAGQMGVQAGNALTYAANDQGTQSLYRSLSDKTVKYRAGAAVTCAFDADDVKAQAAAGLANVNLP